MPQSLLPEISLPSLAAVQAERARRAQRRGYRADPVAWATDYIAWQPGEGLAPYQAEGLTALARRRRAAIRAPHTAGKTMLAALAVLWFADTRDGLDDWKIPTTAGSWLQLIQYLWPEIHKWARRLRWERMGRSPYDPRTELQTLSLKLRTGSAFAAASDQPTLLEGAHATQLLYIFDEAKAIRAATFDAAEGAFAGAGADTVSEAYALAISTPGEPSGRFYEIHRRAPGYEDWWTRHVTQDEAMGAGRMSREWAEQRRRQWGESSAVYQNRVLGEFAAHAEDSVIPLAWVEAANERWRELAAAGQFAGVARITTVGVDVGLTGDRTKAAPRAGDWILEVRDVESRGDTMVVAGQVRGLVRPRGGRAIVDVIGIGAGVVHRLQEEGVAVLAFNAAGGTDATDLSGELGFLNLRAAAWWGLRERLDPSRGSRLALPPDDELTGDLTAPKWRVTSSGKIQVEDKAEIRKRLGRSTDAGDAVVMAFADGLLGPGLGIPTGVGDRANPWRI